MRKKAPKGWCGAAEIVGTIPSGERESDWSYLVDRDQLKKRSDGGSWIPSQEGQPEKVDKRGDDPLHLVQELKYGITTALRDIRERYFEREIALQVEIGGKIGKPAIESPTAYFRVAFEACPFGLRRENSGQVWQLETRDREPGWVDKTMLVVDVNAVEDFDYAWDAGTKGSLRSPNGLIPGIKWLEFINPLAFPDAKQPDRGRAGDFLPSARVVEDRELSTTHLFFRERPTLTADRELNDEMIERRAKVMDGVSEDQPPVVPNGWGVLNVKDVLMSVFVALSAERVCVFAQDFGDFRPQSLRVALASPELSLAPFQGWAIGQHHGINLTMNEGRQARRTEAENTEGLGDPRTEARGIE